MPRRPRNSGIVEHLLMLAGQAVEDPDGFEAELRAHQEAGQRHARGDRRLAVLVAAFGRGGGQQGVVAAQEAARADRWPTPAERCAGMIAGLRRAELRPPPGRAWPRPGESVRPWARLMRTSSPSRWTVRSSARGSIARPWTEGSRTASTKSRRLGTPLGGTQSGDRRSGCRRPRRSGRFTTTRWRRPRGLQRRGPPAASRPMRTMEGWDCGPGPSEMVQVVPCDGHEHRGVGGRRRCGGPRGPRP